LNNEERLRLVRTSQKLRVQRTRYSLPVLWGQGFMDSSLPQTHASKLR
jgi:hypothetical protein